MEKLNKLLDKSIGSALVSCILSGKKNTLGGTDKVKIRQVILKDRHMFQVTEYAGTKVFHQNIDASSAKDYVRDKLLTEFKQCQIQCREHTATVLVSSKGKFTIKEKGAELTLSDTAQEERELDRLQRRYGGPGGEPGRRRGPSAGLRH